MLFLPSVYPNKNAGPSSPLPRENKDKGGVGEIPETTPEDSSIAETSIAMETEESPRDVAVSLDAALRNKSILRSKILKSEHHAEFLKKCVEAGKIPRASGSSINPSTL